MSTIFLGRYTSNAPLASGSERKRQGLCLLEKLKNLHVNQHWILGGTAQVSTGWYQEPHLGVKATRNREFVSMDNWLRFLDYYLGYYVVILPHEEQRRVLKRGEYAFNKCAHVVVSDNVKLRLYDN